jgi:AraC-like DNA-binding protein
MSIINRSNIFAVIEAYYSLLFEQFNMIKHEHSRCEIMYISKGHCTVDVLNCKSTLKQGQFIFINKNVPHSLNVAKGSPCAVINIEFSYKSDCSANSGLDLNKIMDNVSEFNSFINSDTNYKISNDTGNLCYALRDLILELEEIHNKNIFVINILFTRVLIELSRCITKNDISTGIIYVKKAQEFIKNNYETDISVKTIAGHAGINHSYLQKLFKKHLHCGIMTYANNLRLQKSVVLLINSTLNITEIAFEVGFNSRQHFGYTFEKLYKINPQRYRIANKHQIDVVTENMKKVDYL